MRLLLLVLLILNALVLPISLIVLAEQAGLLRQIELSINRQNMVDLIVENASGKVLYVTPIGRGDSGRLLPLPLFDDGESQLFSEQRARFRVEPGERLRLFYPWHDHRHSHLVVEDESGEAPRQMGGSPLAGLQPSPTRAADFVIPDPATLPPVSPQVQAAYQRALVPYHRPRGPHWVWYVVPVLSFTVLLVLFVRQRAPKAWMLKSQ